MDMIILLRVQVCLATEVSLMIFYFFIFFYFIEVGGGGGRPLKMVAYVFHEFPFGEDGEKG